MWLAVGRVIASFPVTQAAYPSYAHGQDASSTDPTAPADRWRLDALTAARERQVTNTDGFSHSNGYSQSPDTVGNSGIYALTDRCVHTVAHFAVASSYTISVASTYALTCTINDPYSKPHLYGNTRGGGFANLNSNCHFDRTADHYSTVTLVFLIGTDRLRLLAGQQQRNRRHERRREPTAAAHLKRRR